MLAGLGSLTAFSVLKRDGEKLRERFDSSKTVERDMEQFKERMEKIKTPEQLLKDRKALETVLTSFQLDTEIGKTGILRKLMTEDPKADGSLAQRLADPRYRRFAEAMTNFPVGSTTAKPDVTAEWKVQPSKNKDLMASIESNYKLIKFERDTGQGNAGLQEALYFRRNIQQVTSVPQLMSDPGHIGLSEKFALLDYEKQRDILKERLDLDKLKDPKELDKFIQRFLVNAGGANGGGSAQANAALSIMGGGGGMESIIGSRLSLRV